MMRNVQSSRSSSVVGRHSLGGKDWSFRGARAVSRALSTFALTTFTTCSAEVTEENAYNVYDMSDMAHTLSLLGISIAPCK